MALASAGASSAMGLFAFYAIALPIGLVLWRVLDSKPKIIDWIDGHRLGVFWSVFTVLMLGVVVFGDRGLLSGNMRPLF